MKRRTFLSTLLLALVTIVLVVAVVGLLLLRPAPELLQGEVEAEQIRISGILAGRVSRLLVAEGDYVEAGDTLVCIHSSLVEAQHSSAAAMRDAAQAETDLVDAGARREVIQAAHDVLLQAQAALVVAEKSYTRVQSLYQKGVVSAQRYDEVLAAYEMARAAENVARSQYTMTLQGARREERRASQAMLQAAEGGVAEVGALLEDAVLTSPRDGVVSEIFPMEGELVSLGAPVMNILMIDRMWVSLNVREELLQHFALHSQHEATIPALGNRTVLLEVYYIKDMGNYAVWHATRTTGEYDAKTFNVRLRPLSEVVGLLPGMSVLLKDKIRSR